MKSLSKEKQKQLKKFMEINNFCLMDVVEIVAKEMRYLNPIGINIITKDIKKHLEKKL